MQWYVISVIRGSLYEKFGNKKCVKILKFWRTELPSSNLTVKFEAFFLMPRTYLQKDRCNFAIGILSIKLNKSTSLSLVLALCQHLDSQGIYTWFSYAKSIIDETGLNILQLQNTTISNQVKLLVKNVKKRRPQSRIYRAM
jgi:hypothetical protein